MSRPLFDDYLIVDWSAANGVKRGSDSIWIAHARSGVTDVRCLNPPSRTLAIDCLLELARLRRRVLIGFDFALGFPQGFAAAAGIRQAGAKAWLPVWNYLERTLQDDSRNRNNRLAVAAGLNQRVFQRHPQWGEGFPFWGAGGKPPWPAAPDAPQQLRGTDRRMPGGARPKPVWQLAGQGCVGSQTLVGIAHAARLRRALRARRRTVLVWPFDGGFRAPQGPEYVVMAEVYPSMLPADPIPGDAGQISAPVKDQRQVWRLVTHFRDRDANGGLRADFEPRPDRARRRAAVAEEGWILGFHPGAI